MSNLSVPTRCLIEWQLLTLVRPSKASGARWAEIDFDAKLWTIPADSPFIKLHIDTGQ